VFHKWTQRRKKVFAMNALGWVKPRKSLLSLQELPKAAIDREPVALLKSMKVVPTLSQPSAAPTGDGSSPHTRNCPNSPFKRSLSWRKCTLATLAVSVQAAGQVAFAAGDVGLSINTPSVNSISTATTRISQAAADRHTAQAIHGATLLHVFVFFLSCERIKAWATLFALER
jgi:hypothetical protein